MLDYAAPEELEGKEITRRSNIYSLGVILYELLSGHRPKLPVLPFDIFPQANMPKEEPLEEARPGLAGETYRLVRNCLWRQEWSRFETADELITAIETAIFAEQELPKAASWAPKRNRPLVYLIPVAVVLLALLGFFVLRGLRGNPAEAAEETPVAETTPDGVAGVGTVDAGPTASSTPTATIELGDESAVDVSITVLAPAPGRQFTLQDTITFDWYWPTLPKSGQHFAVYLIDGEQEHQLGALTEPNNGPSYQLAVAGEDIPTTGDELTWQVRLESTDGSDVELASNPVPIIILAEATSTSTATATAEPPSATPTVAEACVVSPPPGWVVYNVRDGDALSDLAERANLEVETLMQVNCLANDLLSVGQPLWVPLAAVPRTPTPPPPPPTSAPPPPSPTTGGSTPEPRPPTNTPGANPPTDEPTEPPTEEPTLTPPQPTEPGPP
jgi:serine/threonine protein kinase